ncbi:putative transposase [Geoalkalibacter ferrihydriticus]|uniref:Uncharacterized protein n=2 Tax=Geoalkalibacter ferrihydriticus TaxID=392333 RepID=A0A0C2HLK8_9BACT|nr:hypothetical protein [Geoalkalibacter ferrihydriticus]KIH77986.1 hypothetical protein GFER_05125 [Geoalkalibacter ferrihydriticus DSM 17813]SDM34062.1 putative transposase [Geoalkalibacter ferrihydriticus]
MHTNDLGRNEAWSQSLAVGSEAFVLGTQERLGVRGKNRNIDGNDDFFVLREPEESYGDDFTPKN